MSILCTITSKTTTPESTGTADGADAGGDFDHVVVVVVVDDVDTVAAAAAAAASHTHPRPAQDGKTAHSQAQRFLPASSPTPN